MPAYAGMTNRLFASRRGVSTIPESDVKKSFLRRLQ
jgi:hypothetical protein